MGEIEAGMDSLGASAEGEMAQAALHQMIGGEPGGLGVIAADKWEGEIGAGSAEIDHGHFQIQHHVGDFGGIDSDEDSIAFPVAEPLGWWMPQAAGMEIDGPAGVLAVVAGDAAKKSAAIGACGFDQEGDMPERGFVGGGGWIGAWLALRLAMGRSGTASAPDGGVQGSTARTRFGWIITRSSDAPPRRCRQPHHYGLPFNIMLTLAAPNHRCFRPQSLIPSGRKTSISYAIHKL